MDNVVIHLVAPRDKSKWNEVWVKCFETIKRLPYKIKIWTDEEIDEILKKDDKEFYYQYFDRLPNIFKYDYVRYILLYRYGGIYMDMDVEVVEDFIPRLDPNMIYFMEGTRGTHVENSIMWAGNKGKQMWEHLKRISRVKMIEDVFFWADPVWNIMHYVGPWMMSEVTLRWYKKDVDYQILGHEQFSNPKSAFSVAKHYSTNVWFNPSTNMNGEKIMRT